MPRECVITVIMSMEEPQWQTSAHILTVTITLRAYARIAILMFTILPSGKSKVRRIN